MKMATVSEVIDTKPRKTTYLTPTMVLPYIINPCSFDHPVYRSNIGMSVLIYYNLRH